MTDAPIFIMASCHMNLTHEEDRRKFPPMKEEEIQLAVLAMRAGRTVIANCDLFHGVTFEFRSGDHRAALKPFDPPWPNLDSPGRPMMRNLFPAPRTETADVEATMRLAKTAGEIRQRLEDPGSDFNVLLELNRNLEAARKARAVPQPQEPTDAEVEAAARAIGDWVPVLSRQTARLAARAALIAARKARA